MDSNVDLESLMPDHPLYGAMLKIKRAKGHILDLETQINAFLATDPYKIISEYDLQTRTEVWKVEVRSNVPAALAGPIGDCVHNLRSVFDLIAWQIVKLGGVEPSSQVYFPINGKAKSFETKGLAKIDGATKEAIELVRLLQPYQGTHNHVLWAINDLDAIDKHRSIIPVAGGTIETKIDVIGMMFGPTQRDALIKEISAVFGPNIDHMIDMFPRKETLFLEDQVELMRVGNLMAPKGKDNLQAVFEIVFGPDQPLSGEPVVASLNQCIQFSEAAVQLFANRLFR